MSDDYDTVFLEYPGRGERIDEPYAESVECLVEDLFLKIRPEIDELPYYVFGHSLGGLIAYELLLKLQNSSLQMPVMAFISGRLPPDFCKNVEIVSDKPDMDFLDVVSKYGGIPHEFYDNPKIRELFLPILRADFRLLEKYKDNFRTDKLNCDMTILYADGDASTPEKDVKKWKEFSNGQIYFSRFEGGHFYCMDVLQYQKIVDLIEQYVKTKGG